MVKWRNCMKNNLSFIPRIFSICLVNKISLSLEKFERKPREVGRARSREWWDRDVQEMSEEEFRQNFRLSRGAFNKLCQRLDPLVGKQETFARNTVSTARRVAIALYYAFFYFNWLCRHTLHVSDLGVQSSSGGNRLQSGRNGSGIFVSNSVCACAVPFLVSTKTRTSLCTIYTGIFKS